MKLKRHNLIMGLIAAGWAYLPLHSVAQTTDTGAQGQIWTYERCVAHAVENSTEIRRNILATLQADESVGSAKDAWLPSVGFSTSHNFANYPSREQGAKNNLYNSSYGINAAWTVWEGNVRKHRLQSAKLLRQQQELTGEDLIKNLKLNILQAYLDILYAKEAVEIAQKTLEVSSSQTERARRLMESGRTSKVDYAQIESQNAQDIYNVEQSLANLSSARMNLKKLLMLGLNDSIETADITFPDTEVLTPLPSRQTVYDFAASWLPGFKSNELNKEIYANDIKIAKAGYMPSITLQGGVSTGYNNGGDGWGTQMRHGFNENVGVTLSVPIYDGNATNRAVAKAKLAAMDYDITRDELYEDLSRTIENLYIEARNARAKYNAGITRLEATELTATLVDRQFELGLVNPLELLTAHNNLLNARLEQLQNKYMAILANKTINYYATTEVSLP